nr:response regulator [Aliiruegeria lutimaris]
MHNAGLKTIPAETAADGLALFRELLPDILVLDLGLPDGDGSALMANCLRLAPRCRVSVVTANRSVPIAVEAMRKGAFNFLLKPFGAEQFLEAIRNAQADIGAPPTPFPEDANDPGGVCGFIGNSRAMQKVYERIRSAARRDAFHPVSLRRHRAQAAGSGTVWLSARCLCRRPEQPSRRGKCGRSSARSRTSQCCRMASW